MLVVVVMALLVIVETTLMIKAATNTSDSPATLVVLGCKVNGERPSRMLGERLEAAYEYLNAHPDALCVVSGGKGEDEGISEAECMSRYLVEKGIDESRIYKEDKSTSTRENLQFSYQIIKDNGLNPAVAIVTNEFHEYRAGEIAKKLGIDFSAVSANTNLWLLPTYYIRELYGILYEWVF